jgi:hypothetical protein
MGGVIYEPRRSACPNLDEWERRIKQKLRDRGWPVDDIDRRADESMRRLFKTEWMDARSAS